MRSGATAQRRNSTQFALFNWTQSRREKREMVVMAIDIGGVAKEGESPIAVSGRFPRSTHSAQPEAHKKTRDILLGACCVHPPRRACRARQRHRYMRPPVNTYGISEEIRDSITKCTWTPLRAAPPFATVARGRARIASAGSNCNKQYILYIHSRSH